MPLRNTPIKRKLMFIILLTSGVVLVVTCLAFFATEYISFRRATIRHLSTLGQVIAANSTVPLAFQNADDARENLRAIEAEPHISAAALYDKKGALFAWYPDNIPTNSFPSKLDADGYTTTAGAIIGYHAVIQSGNRLGTLYLKSDDKALLELFKMYSEIVLAVMLGTFILAYLLSTLLQKQISRPILALAGVARAVSFRHDYSERAQKQGNDELGLLTDAFNQMLEQIHVQDRAMRESEARIRAVINSALSAVIVIDSNGKITEWNARAETLFGWPRVEALARDLADTIIPERYRAAHRRGLEHASGTGAGPVLNRLTEMSALRRDGTEFPVELSISPMHTGAATTFCGFITDITERKQAETRLRDQLARLNLLHQITRGIGERQDLQSIFQVILRTLESDMPLDFGSVCLYNAAAEELTVSSLCIRKDALSSELQFPLQSRIPIDENGLAKCLRGELVYEPDTSQVQFAFPKKLAASGLRSLVLAPLIVEGKVFGALIVARLAPNSFSSADCEFIRQLSEHAALAAHQASLYNALQQAYDDLRQTQHTVLQQERLRALGQMASGIAHDINNAISPVALYTESLLEREPNLSPRARDYLRTIQRAIDDVAETVTRMREFYRQREPQLVLAPIAINKLVQHVLDLTRARWRDLPQEHGIVIDLRTELAEDPPAFMGAEGEIRDALTNLIFNALDAMPAGGTLTIRTKSIKPEDPELPPLIQIEVSDTGAGMDEETRRRCLEPFFTTKGERGTGLGLAMVYGMVQRHSAEIEIESELGKGTTMRIGFPIFTPAVSTAVRPPALQTPMRRFRILVVDDDPLLTKSLRDTLEADGHAVTSTDGGQAGIDAFTAAHRKGPPFAIVITDLGMPHVDGRRVAAAIKAESPATPVILLTGWGRRILDENDIPAHVDRVLSKPPKLQELRTALAEMVPDNSPAA